eukprot:3893560-Pyramimonas_sp.AAC.1
MPHSGCRGTQLGIIGDRVELLRCRQVKKTGVWSLKSKRGSAASPGEATRTSRLLRRELGSDVNMRSIRLY